MGLPSSGYSDVMLHAKETVDREDYKRGIFPITRYDDVVNRPRVVETVSDAVLSDFHFVKTKEIELTDDEVYNLFGQIW